jgi:peroxiredoxin
MCPIGETSPPATAQEAFLRAAATDAPLAEQLAVLTAGLRQARPEISSAYDKLADRLALVKLGGAGPKPGEPMPDFVLPDQDGHLTSLSSLLATGPLVVSLNRGHWCPYCRLETRALAGAQGRFAGLGASLVSIVPERAEYTRQFRRANDLEFPVLCDIDVGYALTLGLVMWIGEEINRRYSEAGIDLALFHGGTGQVLPVPATFVVGADGLIKARYVDPDFRKRMAVEDIEAALAALRSTSLTPSLTR